MPYSYAVYTGNGATTQFTVPFPYIRREHVVVSVNYVSTVFTWINNTTVEVSPAPANATRVEVRRVTPVNNPLVDFTDGSTLVAADLDTNALQQTYVNQEQDDQIRQGVYVDATGNLTAGNQRIQNVADPTAAQDAATKNYVDTTTVASAGDTMTGALAMSGQKITGLGDPTNAQDAATKTWVETATTSPLVQFRSIFYGAYATDPAVDPYGAARTEGDLYFNTTLDQMRVFNGTSWQEASADATITRFKFTAAGGETSLSGNDDNAQSLTYNVGLEMVYINGALMTRGVDYVATTGSSITGLAALSAADLVEVVAFSQIDAIGSIPSANSTFLQSGTGAVQRTVDNKLKDVVSVKDFGAVGDGVADDTAAIQAAIDSLSAQGGAVYLPEGDYLTTSAITVAKDRVSITGEGYCSRIVCNNATSGAIVVKTPNEYTFFFNLSDLQIRMSAASVTAGAALTLDGVTRAAVRNLYIDDGVIGIDIKGCSQLKVDNVHVIYEQSNGGLITGRRFLRISETTHTGISSKHSGDVFISNFNGRCGGVFYCETGIEINSGDGIWIDNFHIGNCTTAHMLIAANSTVKCAGIVVRGGWFDQSIATTYGLIITGSTPTINRDFLFKDCRFLGTDTGLNAIDIDGSAQNIHIQDCDISRFGNAGINIRNTFTGSGFIVGNRIKDCSMSGAGLASGITYPSSTVWAICDNYISGANHSRHIGISGVKTEAYINNNILAGPIVTSAMDKMTGTTISQANNVGFNPTGQETTAAGASPWTFTNTKGYPLQVFVHGGGAGTITDFVFVMDINGTRDSYDVIMGPGQSFTVTYTGSIYAYMSGL
jgi:hypothetical protein